MEQVAADQQQTVKEVHQGINKITHEFIIKLSNLWTNIFEHNVCNNNLKKLIEHTQTFYDEILDETEQRRQVIVDSIKKLHAEASELKRLLQVHIELEPQNDIPLFSYQMQLDENLQDLRLQLRARKDQIKELLDQQNELCSELDETTDILQDDPLPAKNELEKFQLHLDNLRMERLNRMAEIQQLRYDIKELSMDLELPLIEEPGHSLINDPAIKPTTYNINRLKNFYNSLQHQKDDILQRVQEMKSKLTILWKCLDEKPDVIAKFISCKDCKQSTYDKILRELNRCQQQKRQNIKTFVDKIREEIKIYWDKTMKSEQERARFIHFHSDCYTEDLLSLHEMELDDLRSFYDKNEAIFKKYCERQELWERLMSLEAKENEPGRYNNRGGQLLKEEKERRAISTQLPKIEIQIKDLIEKYQLERNRNFLIWGESVVDLMERDWIKRKDDKEKLMSARKAGKDQQLTPAIQRSMLKTRAQTSSIKRMASCTQLATTSTSKKYKLTVPSELPNVKRNLLTELNTNTSPGKFVKPKQMVNSRTPYKRVISTLTEPRRSNPLNRSKKSNKIRRSRKIPKIVINDEPTITSDSMSYEKFEDHISSRSPCRSSIVTTEMKRKHKELNRLHQQQLGNTPLKFQMRNNHINDKSIAGSVGVVGGDGRGGGSSTKKHPSLKLYSIKSPQSVTQQSPGGTRSNINVHKQLTVTTTKPFLI